MLAAAMEVEIERPEMPESEGESDVLAEAAMYAQQHDVAEAIGDGFAAQRAKDVKILIECMDRKRRYGKAIDAAECEEMGALLGKRPNSVAEGNVQLCAAMLDREGGVRLEDAAIIRYLSRKAYRDEWLYQPAADIYPKRFWAELD